MAIFRTQSSFFNMSINHKSAAEIVIIALKNKNPKHITIGTFLSLAKYINTKTGSDIGLDETLDTKNGTAALQDLLRIYTNTENVCKIESLITLGVMSDPANPDYVQQNMLKGQST